MPLDTALPEPLPADPLPLLDAWLVEARTVSRHATSMALATADPDGRPSVRMVICRGLDTRAGWLVFYTDRDSPKGQALRARPWAAAVFHWEALERQARIAGPVALAPDADSDAYWHSRPLDARIAALASRQSQPVDSRRTLLARIAEVAREAGASPPRPERWGGYRLWAERVELWVSQPARAHDRAVWTRRLDADGTGSYAGGPWSATRLMP